MHLPQLLRRWKPYRAVSAGALALTFALLTPVGSAWAQVCPPGSTFVNSVAALCAVAGNTCAAGVATLNGNACVADGAVLDFNAAGFPTVTVGGTVALEDKNVPQLGNNCAAKPSPELTLLAGDMTITSTGHVNGDTSIVASRLTNGGAIFLRLTAGVANVGSLIIEPGGRLTSDRLGTRGNGRGGNITVLVDGQINVQADDVDGDPRGTISSNTQASARAAFDAGCGVAQITLVATGEGAPPTAVIRIAGTVENVAPPPSVERFLGGVLTFVAGGDDDDITVPPFPSANPPTNPNNPPNNPPANGARMVVTRTGLINIDAKDAGGGQIYAYACFVTVHGLIQAGGNAHTGTILGRETQIPTIIAITAHETIEVRQDPADAAIPWLIPGVANPGVSAPPGGINGTLRAGLKQHLGQGLTDAVQGLGTGCVYVFGVGTGGSGPGGADICLFARAGITIDGANLPVAPTVVYAVRANVNLPGERGGTVLIDPTNEGVVELVSNAVSVNAPGTGGRGGQVVIQSADNVTVDGSSGGVQVSASGPPTGSGGRIDVEAVEGAITQTGGQLVASPALGTIMLRECVDNAADDPTATATTVTRNVDCSPPNAFMNPPVLVGCGGACSCIDSVRLRTGTLTIRGTNLGDVGQVELNNSCAPDGSCVVNQVAFLTQSATTITLTVPACALAGDHVIVGDPGPDNVLGTADDISPSTSCSRDIFPF